jgi:hypothetical protein
VGSNRLYARRPRCRAIDACRGRAALGTPNPQFGEEDKGKKESHHSGRVRTPGNVAAASEDSCEN